VAEHDPARGGAVAGDALRAVAAQLREPGVWAATHADEIELRAAAYDIALRSALSIERDLRKRLAAAESRIADLEAVTDA